jgi:hypothetical protein
MKTIRYVAAICLIIAAVVYFYFAINPPPEFNSASMVIFGVLYLVTAVLILLKKRFALFLGLIPVIPLAMAPFVLEFSNMDWTFLIFPAELIAVICCLILIFKKVQGVEE